MIGVSSCTESPNQGTYPSGNRANVVPGSDGAGIVEATGSRVKRFRKGDRVITLFNQTHIAGPLTTQDRRNGLGNSIDGTMREYGAFSEQGLVKMPESLDFRQACTLSCAGVTAWNALYGLEGRTLKPGDEVLVQGTGGVTLFALQVKLSFIVCCFILSILVCVGSLAQTKVFEHGTNRPFFNIHLGTVNKSTILQHYKVLQLSASLVCQSSRCTHHSHYLLGY